MEDMKMECDIMNCGKEELSPQEKDFIDEIRKLIQENREKTYVAANIIMIQTYWQIGERIIQQEQRGRDRADYGSFLIRTLSTALAEDFGGRISVANLKNFRQFYQIFPEEKFLYTKCRGLMWSHLRLIMRLEAADEREYYLKETREQNWSVRTLERKIKTRDFQRILSTRKKITSMDLERETMNVLNFVKDPYFLEFMGLQENALLLESHLESAIISHLQKFLLELGKGFSFVARQMRLSSETNHFYVDLVFYNYLLKCFVLIDLKTTKLAHQDIGQMEMYVRMFDDLKRGKDDNPTIGIIFCTDKDETIVKYSVLNEAKQIFASKYKTVLPSEEELQNGIENQCTTLREGLAVYHVRG